MFSVLNRAQYKNFTLGTLSNFFFFCNFSSFFLLPLYIKELGGNEASIGYIMGTFGFTSLGSIPLVSYLIDRYGRRAFMLLGSVIMFISSFAYVYVHEIGITIYFLRTVQGFGFALFFTSVSTFVSDTVPAGSRAYGLGIFGAFTIASYAIGPTIGEMIIWSAGFEYFFLYASSFSLVSLILAVFTVPTPFKASRKGIASGFVDLVISKRYRTVLIINVIIASGLGVMLNFFADFLNMRGFTVSYFFVTYTITVTAVRVFAGRLPDIYGQRNTALPCLIVLALSLMLISTINTDLMVITVSLLFSLGYGMLYPAISSIIVERAGDDERGKAMGAFNATFSFGINFLAFPFGYMAKQYGYESMYFTAGLLVIAGFFIFLLYEHGNTTNKVKQNENKSW